MYARLKGTHCGKGCQGAEEEGSIIIVVVVVVGGAAFVNYPHEFDSFHQKVARVPDENANEHEYANVENWKCENFLCVLLSLFLYLITFCPLACSLACVCVLFAIQSKCRKLVMLPSRISFLGPLSINL